jgi:hypothetical protein
VKIQEPSSSIRETERKESPEWQCTSVPPLEGTREWQNPVTTTFILVLQRNTRILYASETTRDPNTNTNS